VRKNSKGEEGGKVGQERWLLTYADMITLLLALFIVMYSMSTIDAEKFSNVTKALAGQLKAGQSIFEKSLGSDIIEKQLSDLQELRVLQQSVRHQIIQENLRRNAPIGISTKIDQRGLVIHIEESALFDPGKADLKPRAFEALSLVSTQIKGLENPIRIEGHTDNSPINTARFPSNWELSSSRAITVVRYFIEEYEIDPTMIAALGYGEFRPIADNATPEGRALNRRVDIVVLSQSEIKKEPPKIDEQLADFEQSDSLAESP
jgi:chemotaxis protein MotB